MLRIKKGDEVVVISGRDKGKRGAVLRRVDHPLARHRVDAAVGERDIAAEVRLDPPVRLQRGP